MPAVQLLAGLSPLRSVDVAGATANRETSTYLTREIPTMLPDLQDTLDVPIAPAHDDGERISVRVLPDCVLVGSIDINNPEVKVHLYAGDVAELHAGQVADLLEIGAVELV